MADRPPRPAARGGSVDRVGGDDLVDGLDPLSGQPGSEIARDVVEPERGKDDDSAQLRAGAEAVEDELPERLLATRIEVVRACSEGRRNRPRADREEWAREGGNGEGPVERSRQGGLVLGVGDTDLLPLSSLLLERPPPPSHQTKRDSELPRLLAHELSREARRAENGERSLRIGHSGQGYGYVVGLAYQLDVEAVRRRFSALDSPLAYFDGPGGTQVPDEVIEAIAGYLRESNANVGGPYATSRATQTVIANARLAAAGFLGCLPEEAIFGANMTTLNFMLSRTAARELSEGDEVVVTGLDHDANVSPWLELERDKGIVVRFAGIDEECRLDLADLERQLSERTRVVAFPVASNAVGTLVDVERVVALAHAAGALAWADAVHYAPHGPIDVGSWNVDVLICSPYKFYGPHLGIAFGRAELLEDWRPYKVRPAPDEPLGHRFETGTLPHELLAGFVAAVRYVDSIGWDAIRTHERELGERFLSGLPESCTLYGPRTMEGRVSTFAFNVEGLPAPQVAERLGERNIAVWDGNYYALEVMRRLGLEPEGAVRAGIVHYNTAQEVDRLLEALSGFSS